MDCGFGEFSWMGVNCKAEPPFLVEFVESVVYINQLYLCCYPFPFGVSFENVFPSLCGIWLLKQVGSPGDIKAGGSACQAAKLCVFLWILWGWHPCAEASCWRILSEYWPSDGNHFSVRYVHYIFYESWYVNVLKFSSSPKFISVKLPYPWTWWLELIDCD